MTVLQLAGLSLLLYTICVLLLFNITILKEIKRRLRPLWRNLRKINKIN
jgi:hypothetical protein